MRFAGWVKSSLVDYPGKISCVLFLSGCNYNCFYCHNRSLISSIPGTTPFSDVLSFLQKREGLLDAVVITGGEPTLQKNLLPVLRRLRNTPFLLKLDTNGSMPQVVKKILDENLIDYLSIDYKAPLAMYPTVCGPFADASKVIETIETVIKSGIDYEVRTTVFPDLSQKDLQKMAKELPGQLRRWTLNPYRVPNDYLASDKDRILKKAPTKDELIAWAKTLLSFQENTRT